MFLFFLFFLFFFIYLGGGMGPRSAAIKVCHQSQMKVKIKNQTEVKLSQMLQCTCAHVYWSVYLWFSEWPKAYLVQYRFINTALKRKFRYKSTRSSLIRHHLISILIKSCSTQGCLDLLPKVLQNKTRKQISRCKAVHTLMHFKPDESLAHSSLNFLL